MEGLSGKGPSATTGLDEIFEQFFGGGTGPSFAFDFGPGPKRRKGEDTIVPYDVTLEDLYNGKSVKLNMEKEVLCSTCKGYDSAGFLVLIQLSIIAVPGRRVLRSLKRALTAQGKVGLSYKPKCAFLSIQSAL